MIRAGGGDDGVQRDTGKRPEATACCFAWWNGEEVQTDAGEMQSSLHRLFPARKKIREEASSGTTASGNRYYRLSPEAALPPQYRATSAHNTACYTVPGRYLAGTTA